MSNELNAMALNADTDELTEEELEGVAGGCSPVTAIRMYCKYLVWKRKVQDKMKDAIATFAEWLINTTKKQTPRPFRPRL